VWGWGTVVVGQMGRKISRGIYNTSFLNQKLAKAAVRKKVDQESQDMNTGPLSVLKGFFY
jgi:hypothetical protein